MFLIESMFPDGGVRTGGCGGSAATLSPSTATPHDRLIVTAASRSFGSSLLALLGSLNVNWPAHPPVVVYDIGLDEDTLASLGAFDAVVTRVPAFCPHWRRHFTWKIWCLNDAPGRDVLWIDAGVVVLAPLDDAFAALAALGYFAAPTYRFLAEQAPAAAIRACGVTAASLEGRLTLSATMIGFRKAGKGLALLREAYGLALDERNIAAETPDHRHDQALLSLLLYRHYGRVVSADQQVYLNWRSPAHTVGQKVWVHRRKMLAVDIDHLARQRAPSASGPYVPADPPPAGTRRPLRWLRTVAARVRRIRRGAPRAAVVYDGDRDGAPP